VIAPPRVEAGSREETPLFFPAGEATLFGLLTAPTGDPSTIAAIALAGGWYGTSTGRNRLLVRICRRLAGAGHHALRFDYRGVGDSSGSIDRFRLDDPQTEDLGGAVRALEARGLSRFVLVGVCFGSRTALAGAASVAGLEGVVLVLPPVSGEIRGPAGESSPWTLLRRALRLEVVTGLFDPHLRRMYTKVAKKQWQRLTGKLGPPGPRPKPAEEPSAGRDFLRSLEELVARRVPVLFVYGAEDGSYAEFLRARKGRFGQLLDRAGPQVEIAVLEGPLRGFAWVETQDLLIDRIVEWTSRVADNGRETRRGTLLAPSPPLEELESPVVADGRRGSPGGPEAAGRQ
jgi:pimeloyl-ACP methyl ester carboxylesterase